MHTGLLRRLRILSSSRHSRRPGDPSSIALCDTRFITRTLHCNDRYTTSRYIAPVQGQFWQSVHWLCQWARRAEQICGPTNLPSEASCPRGKAAAGWKWPLATIYWRKWKEWSYTSTSAKSSWRTQDRYAFTRITPRLPAFFLRRHKEYKTR